MRLSLAEARKIGLIPHSSEHSSRQSHPNDQTPQRMIYDALVRRLGEPEVIYEASGLIPGRKYRADIYLPASRITVEMDGFQYHRSKSAFQKDRERQNLFALHGILVLRYFTRQAFRDLYGITDQVVQAHDSRRTSLTGNSP